MIKSIKEMTLEEKIAQTAIIQIKYDDCGKEKVEELIKYSAGGYFVGGEVIKRDRQNGNNIKKIIKSINEQSEIPPIFCADLENGCGNAIGGLTELPHLAALGAVNSEKLAFDYGKTIALQARTIGVNLSLSPVADLSLNPRNMIISRRTAGDKPERVIRLLKSVINGMQSNGVYSCLKHFPGDGVDWRNQHIVTSENSLSPEEWENLYGKIYRELIKEDINAVMVGHISCPAIQRERFDGLCLPGTLSSEIIDYLKNNIGFGGVKISDALSMGGFLGWYEDSVTSQVECFKAGIDMLLFADEGYFEAMKKAVSSGYVSEERLDDAVEKIVMFKEKILHEKKSELPEYDEVLKFGTSVAEKISEKSISLAKGKNFKALRESDKVAVMHIKGVDEDDEWSIFSVFEEEIKKRCRNVDIITDFWLDEVENLKEYDRVIYIANDLDYSLAPIWASLCFNVEKSMVISFNSPYYKEYFAKARYVVNAYSSSGFSQKAAVRVIFGETKMEAASPFELDK